MTDADDYPTREMSATRQRAVLDALPQCVAIYAALRDDRRHIIDFVVEYVNRAACDFNRLPAADQIGKRLNDLFPGHRESGLFGAYCRVVDTGRPLKRKRFDHSDLYNDRLEHRSFTVQALPHGDGVIATWEPIETTTEPVVDGASTVSSDGDFQAMANTAPAMLWVTDARHHCTFLSQGWYDYTGQSEAEGLGLGWVNAVHPDDRAEAERIFLAAAERGEAFDLDYRLRRADGVYRWAIDAGRPRFDADGQIVGYIGSVIDVHERKQAEQQLHRSKALIEGITKSTDELIAAQDADYRYLYFNDAYQRTFESLWGKPLKVGTNMLEALADWPEEQAKAKRLWLRAHHGESFTETVAFGPHEAEQRIYDIRFNPVRDADGNQIGSAQFVRDVTDRVRTQESLKESEHHLRRVLDNLFAFVGVLELDGTLMQVNQAPLDAAGVASEDVLGRKFWDCYWWSYDPQVQHQLREAIDHACQGQLVRYDVLIRVEGNRRIWIDFQLAPLCDSNGRITHLIPSAMDITDRKRVEGDLRDSEALLSAVLDALPVGVVIADARGRIVRDNQANRELWGIPPQTDSWEQYSQWVGWWPDSGKRIEAHEWAMARALREGITVHNELVRNQRFDDGEQRLFLNNAAPVRDADGNIIGGVVAELDVTERLAAENALRDSEQRLRTLADNISQFAWMTDETGWIFWYNRRWYDYTGTDLQQMQGWGWTAVHHPDHVDRVVAGFKSAIESGEPWEDVFPLRSKKGEYRWFLSRAQPIRDADGQIFRWFGTNTDITAQRAAEQALQREREMLDQRVRDRTEELRRRADQLSRLSSELTLTEQRERQRLAAVLHDHLQQLLVAARFGLANVADEQADPNQRQMVEQTDKLISEAIDASRSLTVELAPPILHEAGLAAGFQWLARQMKEKHGLRTVLDGELDFDVDREDVRVLVFESVRELLFNTVKHGGVDQAILRWRQRGDGPLQVTIEDQGRGFDVRSALSPGPRDGNGYGLFSIRERITLLGGDFEISSSPGRGSRFVLSVPGHASDEQSMAEHLRKDDAAADKQGDVDQQANDQPASTIRLLLVDDHEVLRQGLAAVFNRQPDMQVVGEASNGEQAVDAVTNTEPDIVLMDFSMPDMNGVEATRRIVRQVPRVRIIGLSMYEEPERAAAMLGAGAVAYATKSGDINALLRKIRAASNGGT